jgi:hypothetical protein
VGEEWRGSSGIGAGTEKGGWSWASGAETERAGVSWSAAGDAGGRERGRRSELDRELRASQASSGMAKSSGPESPRLRQSSSTSPSALPLMRKSKPGGPGARSSERDGRIPGDRCSANEDDDQDAPAEYSMCFTAFRRSNCGLRPRLPLPLLSPPLRLLDSMLPSAPPRRPEEEDGEAAEEDFLRPHENIWIHTRSSPEFEPRFRGRGCAVGSRKDRGRSSWAACRGGRWRCRGCSI